MTQLLSSNLFACPGCRAMLSADQPGALLCPHCRWWGEAHTFTPRRLVTESAEAALPEDAACLHHPTKKATAVCAGTGDYICSLCAVELDGQTYSAAYLEAGGKAKAARAFDRKMPRPDSYVYFYLLLLFVPYVNFIMIPFAFLWLPHAFVLYFRALRMRRENPLFARVMGRTSVITQPILLGLVAVLWLVGVGLLIYAIMRRQF